MPAVKWLTATVFGLFAALGVSSTVFGVVLADARSALGIGLAYAGLVSTLFAAGRTVGSFVSGPLTDRFGEPAVTAGGLAGLVAGLFLFGGAAEPLPFFLGSLVMGLGFGALDVAANTAVSRLHPGRRAAMLSLLHGFYGVGSFAGPVLLGLAAAWRASWRAAPVAAAALFLVAGAAYALAGRASVGNAPVRTGGSRNGPTPFKTLPGVIRRDPRFWLVIPVGFIYQGVSWSLSLWLPTYMSEAHGTGLLGGAPFVSAFFAGLTLGRFVAGTVAQRVGEANMLVAGSVGASMALAFGLLVRHPILAFAGLAATGLCLAPMVPTSLAVLTRLWSDAAGTVSGWFTTLSATAVLFFPWFLGVLSDAWGMRAGLGAGAAALLGLVGITLALRRALGAGGAGPTERAG